MNATMRQKTRIWRAFTELGLDTATERRAWTADLLGYVPDWDSLDIDTAETLLGGLNRLVAWHDSLAHGA